LGAVAALLCSLAIPLRADAGGATTAHQLTMTIKGSAQGTNNSGDGINDRATGSIKDVFALCTESLPTKTQGVYLFLNCDALNDNLIAAVETDPFTGLQEVGSVDFDLANQIVTTKSGDTKLITVPVAISLNCNGGALVVEASGIMDIKYSPLAAGPICPLSATLKITGVGTSNSGLIPDSFILDDGSSVKAKNRSGAISSFPVF
jgi:hypothetical protein